MGRLLIGILIGLSLQAGVSLATHDSPTGSFRNGRDLEQERTNVQREIEEQRQFRQEQRFRQQMGQPC